MQTRDLFAVLSDLLSRLTPSRVSVYQGDDGEPQLFLALAVRGDVDGQRWRQFERRYPQWPDLVNLVTVMFVESCHSPRSWKIIGSLVDGEGSVPEGDGPVVKVLLAFALAEPEGVVAEELPPVKMVTFGFAKAEDDGGREAGVRRHLTVVRVPSGEREGC
ncbi:MAG: hypothetical protein HZC26_01145 [Candidatus Magasanikbacteria bacterium]|nr:hypothetical protein [Candidatus Magasanikbacteria bacterium]